MIYAAIQLIMKSPGFQRPGLFATLILRGISADKLGNRGFAQRSPESLEFGSLEVGLLGVGLLGVGLLEVLFLCIIL